MMSKLIRTVGRGGNAGSLYFDGDDDFLEYNIDITMNDSFTINLYSKMVNDNPLIFRNIISTGGNYQLGFALEEGRLLIYDRTDLAAKVIIFSRTNEWTFFTIINNAINKNIDLYIDGEKRGELTYKSISSNYNNLTSGIRFGASNIYTRMNLACVSYYSRILHPNEIKILSQGLPISRVGLVGEWKMNEMDGNIAYDTSGNGNHATIYGANYTTDKPY